MQSDAVIDTYALTYVHTQVLASTCYITFHSITYHCIPLSTITYHCIPFIPTYNCLHTYLPTYLHYPTLHYPTLPNIAKHYKTLPNITHIAYTAYDLPTYLPTYLPRHIQARPWGNSSTWRGGQESKKNMFYFLKIHAHTVRAHTACCAARGIRLGWQ